MKKPAVDMTSSELAHTAEQNAHIRSNWLYDRRSFLKTSGTAAAAAVPFAGFLSRKAEAAILPYSADYGPLSPKIDETTGLPLIALPDGFRYISYGWTGDVRSDGGTTPGSHDGMAVAAVDRDILALVRNHERRGVGSPFCSIAYDPVGIGGTTTLEFDARRGKWKGSCGSLSGTITNCAGGPTPWGSWLTCEEDLRGPDTTPTQGYTRPHGYVFDVPGFGTARPEPLTALGRFVHEAVAVDPVTGIVYLTEDSGSCGFYRFLPNVKGKLSRGGKLQMLKVVGVNQADLRGGFANGSLFATEWVDINDPDPQLGAGAPSCYSQGFVQGGATFIRGEGCWYGAGVIYWISTSGGAARRGQVWAYDPRREELQMFYESPGAGTLDSPDNIAVSPRGALLLCEDGSNSISRMHGLTMDGEIFPFAENQIVLNGEVNGIVGSFTGSEWAGATFYNEWLFVNIQSPGVTFAITGPWDNGAL